MYALRLVIRRQRTKPRAQVEAPEMPARQQRRGARKSRRASRKKGADEQTANAIRHLSVPSSELWNLGADECFTRTTPVPSIDGADTVVYPSNATTLADDSDERVLVEMLKVPALWGLVFADSVVLPYAQFEVEAVGSAVVSNAGEEGCGSGVGVYDSLGDYPALDVDKDIVWTWLAERAEARSWEQGRQLGIIWDDPPCVRYE